MIDGYTNGECGKKEHVSSNGKGRRGRDGMKQLKKFKVLQDSAQHKS